LYEAEYVYLSHNPDELLTALDDKLGVVDDRSDELLCSDDGELCSDEELDGQQSGGTNPGTAGVGSGDPAGT
jgi:hypothetical protein